MQATSIYRNSPRHKEIIKFTRARTPQILERRSKAVALRSRGASYRQIGAALGVSYTQAQRDVRAACYAFALQEAESTAMLRVQVGIELDRLHRAWSKDANTDKTALDATLKILDAKRKLYGLDAPIQLEIDDRREVEPPRIELAFVEPSGDVVDVQPN